MSGEGLFEFSDILTSLIDGSETFPELLRYYGVYTMVVAVVVLFTFIIVRMLGKNIPEPTYVSKLENNRRFRHLFPGITVTIGASEELVFRGIPVLIASFVGWNTFWPIIMGSIVWVLAHEKAQIPGVIVIGILLVQLWMAGLWIEAIVVHAVHNFIVSVITVIWLEISN